MGTPSTVYPFAAKCSKYLAGSASGSVPIWTAMSISTYQLNICSATLETDVGTQLLLTNLPSRLRCSVTLALPLFGRTQLAVSSAENCAFVSFFGNSTEVPQNNVFCICLKNWISETAPFKREEFVFGEFGTSDTRCVSLVLYTGKSYSAEIFNLKTILFSVYSMPSSKLLIQEKIETRK